MSPPGAPDRLKTPIKMATKLQSLTSFWQSFDLPGVQGRLDVVATEITDRQDESETSRKLLIDQMRDFKKKESEEVRTAVTGLVKSFQNEVSKPPTSV